MRDYVNEWSKRIVWKGTDLTNKSDRRGYIPDVICNHISQGNAQSCIEWFSTDSTNKESSAHFLVAKDGNVYQFVDIHDNAWGNGLKADEIKLSTLSVVKSRSVNPNWYTVSIEHEGVYEVTKGALTKEQLESTIMLHKYIVDYVKDEFNIDITVDRNHIVGHFEIKPQGKPNCPGKLFPFDEVINGVLKEPVKLPFDDIDGHWAKDIILEALNLGLIKGAGDIDKDGNNEFEPDRATTRAESIAMIMNLYNKLKVG